MNFFKVYEKHHRTKHKTEITVEIFYMQRQFTNMEGGPQGNGKVVQH